MKQRFRVQLDPDSLSLQYVNLWRIEKRGWLGWNYMRLITLPKDATMGDVIEMAQKVCNPTTMEFSEAVK